GRIAELYPQCVKPQLSAPCLHCPMSCCGPSECVAPEHGAIGTGDLEGDLAISRQPGQAEDRADRCIPLAPYPCCLNRLTAVGRRKVEVGRPLEFLSGGARGDGKTSVNAGAAVTDIAAPFSVSRHRDPGCPPAAR